MQASEKNDQVIELQARLPGRVQLRRIQTPQSDEDTNNLRVLVEQLRTAAAADDHAVLFPTHVFVKDGQIVGYASIATMPVINFWADSTKLHAAESIKMIEQAEAVCSHHGLRSVVVPCAENSPFAQHMERLGYTKLGATVLHIKNL